MSEPEDEQEDLDALKKQVLIHVGVSLARYQKIERGLKAFLPFFVAPGCEPSINPFAEMQDLLASKSTLGPLMERLKDYISSSDSEQTAHYLETVVCHRNELVHQFFQLPIGRMNDTDACHEALQHLRSRLEFAQPLLDLVNASGASLLQMTKAATEQPAN